MHVACFDLHYKTNKRQTSFQGKRAPRSSRDVAAEPFKRVISVCCECALHDCRHISKFSCYNKSMEITNWKEAMLLYDSDLIMF